MKADIERLLNSLDTCAHGDSDGGGFLDRDKAHALLAELCARRESVWHLLKHELEPSGYGSCAVPTEKVMSVHSTKELAQAALARQAEPSAHVSYSIEEWKVDAEDV